MADGFLGHPFRRLLWSPTLLGVPYYQSALADWFETQTVHILKINVPGSAGGLGCSPSWKDELRLLIERGHPPLYFNCQVMGVGLIRSIRCQLRAEKRPQEHDSLEEAPNLPPNPSFSARAISSTLGRLLGKVHLHRKWWTISVGTRRICK